MEEEVGDRSFLFNESNRYRLVTTIQSMFLLSGKSVFSYNQ